MGGLVGYVGPYAGRRADALMAALALSRHHADHTCSVYTVWHNVALGATFDHRDPPIAAYDGERRVGVVLYGFASTGGPAATVVEPSTLIDGYADVGLASLTELDGGFAAVIVDDVRRVLILVNDRSATVPVHFALEGGALAFGPDGKSVMRLLDRPIEFDEAAMLHFLIAGRGVGTRTLFSGVQLLPPGSVIEIGTESFVTSVRRYWRLAFPEAPIKLRPRAAASALFEVYRNSMKRFVPNADSTPVILLTGGYDSRGLLAMALATERTPPEALTWGVADDIADSDPTVACRVSAMVGVPHRFVAYNQATFESRWRDWAWVSELASDNLGSFAAGSGFLREAGAIGSAVLIGDHALGIGAIPINRQDAIESTMQLPFQKLPAALDRWLVPHRNADATALVWDDIMSLVGDGEGERPKDLKDRLGYETGTCRWLNAPTYFREPMITPRRPLLSREALAFFVSLPPHLRVDKVLMIGLLRERFPELASVPTASANALVDWNAFFWRDGFMRRWMGDGQVLRDFLTASPIAAFVDAERVLADLRVAIDEPSALDPALRQARRFSVTSFRRRLSKSHALGRFARGAQILGRKFARREIGVSTRRLLIRHMLLAGFWHMMVGDAPNPARPQLGQSGGTPVWRRGP